MCYSLSGLNHIMSVLLKDPHRLCVQTMFESKSRFNMMQTQGKGMPIKFTLLLNSLNKANENTQLKILNVSS